MIVTGYSKKVLIFRECVSFNQKLIQRYDSEEGELFVFDRNNGGKIGVLISNQGEISLNEVGSKDVQLMAYTGTKQANCIAKNAYGKNMFTLRAEGKFYYNGKTSSITYADGLFTRHFWGSTLNIGSTSLGNKRTVNISGHRYSEVYSRVYYEAVFGIAWAGIVMKSDTVETAVGITVKGNVYSKCARI